MQLPRALLVSLVWFLLVGVVACGGSSSKLPPTITISPTNLTVAAGATLDVAASYEDADGVKTAASNITWAVAGSTIATITPGADGHAAIHGVAMGHTTLTLAGNGATATFVIQVTGTTAVTLTSIEVTPSTKSIALGTTQQMTATGVYSDMSKKDITADVLWATSAADKVTIAAGGLATSVALGAVTVTASLGAVSGTTQLTITDSELVSITVVPATASVAAGRTQQFIATGTFTNQTTQDLTTQVTWASSTAAATVSNAAGSQGLVSALVAGPAIISATKGTITGAAALTVTLGVLTAVVVTPPNPSNAAGTTRQFTATGTFSDATTQDVTTQVAWTSSDLAVATIAATGDATTVAAGSATITATLDAVTGSTTLTVTNAVMVSIEVTPATPSTALGHHVQFKAIATFDNGTTQDLTGQVIWTSTNETIATISNAAATAGNATTLALGPTTIVAAFGGVSGSTLLTVTAVALDSIAVNPPTVSSFPGTTKQFTALEVFSDAHTVNVSATAVWASSNPATATVTATGLATVLALGTTNITASADGFTGTSVVTVPVPSVTVAVPRDTAFGIRATTPVAITFDQPINPATVIGQAANGPCTESVQLSADNFATCLALGAPVFAAANENAQLLPVAPLTALTTYKIRVLATVTSPGGAAAIPFTQATGFTTAAVGACASGLVISQVFGAGGNGGNDGASFAADFIELHNAGATPLDLTGYAVQYASSTGVNWQVSELPAVTLAAGAYFLIQEKTGAGTAPALPKPNFLPARVIDMGGAAGKVALTASTAPLTGACPLGLTNDFVGYGIGATNACREGSGPTLATGNKISAQRNGNGCADANDNAADFTNGVPAPRTTDTAPSVCACLAGIEADDAPAMSFLSDN